MRKDMFKTVGILTVAAWLAVLGAMFVNKTSAPPGPQNAGTAVMDKTDEWYGLYLKGEKIGYAHHASDKTDAGYDVTEYVRASYDMMGTVRRFEVTSKSRLSGRLELISFDYGIVSEDASMDIRGVVDGGKIHMEMDTGGSVVKEDYTLKGAPHLSSDLDLILKEGGYGPGDKFDMPFFDPSSMSEQVMKVSIEEGGDMKIGGRTLPVYIVRQEFAGVTASTWYNPDYGTIKAEAPLGYTLVREPKEQAVKPPEEGYAAADIISMFSVPAEGSIVSDPRGATYMRIRLSGVDLDGLDIDGGRQSLRDGVVTIRTEDIGAIRSVNIPVESEWLSDTPTVQSGSPRIIARAKEIIGSEKDALAASRLIGQWVYDNLAKKPSAGIPSALEVLDNGYGDCNEHTVLFTALARSAGIPTRMCAGLVLMDGRFYYHAWPEVYVGSWVAIDPTFGQFPADATHIRLVYGGPDKQIGLLRVVGNIKAEILESK